TELILVIGRGRLRVPGRSIQVGVPSVFPDVSVDLIRTRLDARGHHSTRGVSELCTEVARLQTEFRKSIGRGPHHEAGAVEKVDQIAVVIDAVKNEVVL